jgi:flagellar M-ring protein FliF
MAKDSVFADKDQSAKASVVLKLRNNRPLSPATVNGITGLVSAAVESLRPEAVVILDTYGRSLSQQPENGEAAAGAAGLDRQQRIEHDLTTRVVSLLEPVVGPGHVRVNVSARLKADVEDQTEERWDQSPVIRSKQTTTESDSRSGTIGTAGARANLPPDLSTSNSASTGAATSNTPASAPNPANPANPTTPPTAANGNATPANGTTPPPAASPSAVPPTATPVVGTTRSSETTNYEVGKVTTHRTSPSGQIARLSVAVILDEEHAAGGATPAAGAPATGTTAAPAATSTTKPRSPEELQRIQQLVAAAVGFDESRGDKLTVDSIAFDTPAEEAPIPAPSGFSSVWDQVRTSVRDQGMSFVRLLGIAIVALVTIFVVLRPMMRNALKVSAKAALPAAAPAAGLPARAPTVEEMQGRLDAGLDPLAGTGAPALARRVAKLAGDEPEQVARVMRGWIADGGR